jgi:hypothetical protein
LARVEVYTQKICPFCVRAKALLNRKGVTFEEIDVTEDAELRAHVLPRLFTPQNRCEPRQYLLSHACTRATTASGQSTRFCRFVGFSTTWHALSRHARMMLKSAPQSIRAVVLQRD